MSKKIDKYNKQRELLEGIGFERELLGEIEFEVEERTRDGIVYEIKHDIHKAPIFFRAHVDKSGVIYYQVYMYDKGNDYKNERFTFPLKTPAAKALKDSLRGLSNEVATTLETKISGAKVEARTSEFIERPPGIVQIDLTSEKPADLVYKQLRKYIETKGKE